MGIIFSNDFIDVASANITARSQVAGYAKENVFDRWNFRRRFRADDVIANNYLLKFNYAAPASLAGILLYDVNFDAVQIQGDAADGWDTPDYPGVESEVSQNQITGRYQIYIPPDAFTYQYSRLFIPPGASAVGDYTAKWEIGAVCFIQSVNELAEDMAFGYGQTGKHFYTTSVNERIQTAEEIRWEGKIEFGNRPKSTAPELWAVNRMNMALPFVYFENRGDDSEAYICVRDDSIEITEYAFGCVSGGTIKIKEAYMLGEN